MTKFCVDCKHYQPATSAGKPRIVHTPARCSIPVVVDLVTGESMYLSCKTRRDGSVGGCGLEAKDFEPKAPPAWREDYRRQVLEPIAAFCGAALILLCALLLWRYV